MDAANSLAEVHHRATSPTAYAATEQFGATICNRCDSSVILARRGDNEAMPRLTSNPRTGVSKEHANVWALASTTHEAARRESRYPTLEGSRGRPRGTP